MTHYSHCSRETPTVGAAAVWAGLVSGAVALPAGAAQYALDYRLEASVEVNDNVNLNPDPIEVSGGLLALPLTFTRKTERTEASLEAEASFYRYDVEEYDSDNQNLQGRLTHQLERGDIEAYAGYLRDSTRDSEFLDTGMVGPTATRRETASGGGTLSRLFSERNGIVAGIDYRDVTYGAERFQDFAFLSGYGGWLHQWSPITQLQLQAYANAFETRGGVIDVQSDGLGVQAGFDTQFSERLSMFLLAGWITVETGYTASPGIPLPPPEDDGSYLLDGRLTYESERSQWQLRLKSEPTPSGNGVLLNTDRLDVNYRYRVTEHAALVVNANIGRQDGQDPRIDRNRDFARTSLRLDYRVGRSWFLGARYRYSWQDAAFFDDSVEGNALFLSLRYQPRASTWSR